MKPLISIVVPVYKVEKYLDKCIQSLINQTYKNIEIVLVNDGSPDNCPAICDNYAKIDYRIKTIHKANGGLSDARNAGVREAVGEYILFVDSDDYIHLDTCERFITALNNNKPDVIVGNAKRIKNDNISLMRHHFVTCGQMIKGKDYLKKELSTGTMFMAAWLNLYNKDFLLNNRLEFKVGLLHEDEEFTPRVFLMAKKVIGTDIVFYNYLIREDSITTSKNKVKNAEHIMQTLKELELVYNNIEDDELRYLLNDDLVNKFLNTFQTTGIHDKKYSYLIDKNFLRNKAYTKRNKLRVFVFNINKKVYFKLNYFTKGIKHNKIYRFVSVLYKKVY